LLICALDSNKSFLLSTMKAHVALTICL